MFGFLALVIFGVVLNINGHKWWGWSMIVVGCLIGIAVAL